MTSHNEAAYAAYDLTQRRQPWIPSPAAGGPGEIEHGLLQNTMLDTAFEISASAIEDIPTSPIPHEYPASKMGV